MIEDEKYLERLMELRPLCRFIQTAVEQLGREKAKELAAVAFEKYACDRFVAPYNDTPMDERWEIFREAIINGADESTYVLERYDDFMVKIRYLNCTFLNIFREFGLEDFVPLYCQTDYITCRRIHHDIAMTRTQTLAEGAAYCDHCWTFVAGRKS